VEIFHAEGNLYSRSISPMACAAAKPLDIARYCVQMIDSIVAIDVLIPNMAWCRALGVLRFNFLRVNFEVFVGHKHYFLRRNFVLAPVPEAPQASTLIRRALSLQKIFDRQTNWSESCSGLKTVRSI